MQKLVAGSHNQAYTFLSNAGLWGTERPELKKLHTFNSFERISLAHRHDKENIITRSLPQVPMHAWSARRKGRHPWPSSSSSSFTPSPFALHSSVAQSRDSSNEDEG